MSFEPNVSALTSSGFKLHAMIAGYKGIPKVYTNIWKGNPQLVVETDDPSERGRREANFGRLTARLNFGAYMTLLQTLEDALTWEPEHSIMLTNMTGGSGERPLERQSVVIVKKNKEGLVCLSILEENRPKLMIPLNNDGLRHHKWTARGGENVDPVTMNRICTMALINASRALIPLIALQTYEKPDNGFGKKGGGGGGSRGGHGGAGDGGGGNSDDFDADIPF